MILTRTLRIVFLSALLAHPGIPAADALSSTTATVSAAHVESFSPQGEAKDIRQVVAHFSEPMVPFGDPRLESPFTIHCNTPEITKGHAHWADAQNWIYDFENDLPAGIQCQFTLRHPLKSAVGNPLKPASYAFTTGGPAIRDSWPREGNTIDEHQVFLLGLDAPATLASIKEHASCIIKGVGEQIPMTIIEGDQREKILQEQKGRASDFFLVLSKRTHQRGILKVKHRRIEEAESIVVAQCSRPLPPAAEVTLSWGKNIQTLSGIPTKEDQSLAFQVRPDFSAKMRCTRLKPDAGCVPVLPITLELSAPITRERAQDIKIRTETGQILHPKLEDEKANTIESLSFEGPFQPFSHITLEIPNNLRDDNNRLLENASSFPLSIAIDDAPPLIKFPSHFGILEANAQPALPVSVRNVETPLEGLSAQANLTTRPHASHPKNTPSGHAIPNPGPGSLARIDTHDDTTVLKWLQRVMNPSYPEGETSILHGHEQEFQAQSLRLPTPHSGKTLDLIGIPLPKPGFYIVEFASKRLGAALLKTPQPYYVYSSALVTNLSVHFKKGHESSLVWVTQLDNAQPVKQAFVRISRCNGTLLWEGETDQKGIAHVDTALPDTEERCTRAPYAFLVTARKNNDFSFVLSNWNKGISRWEFNLGGGHNSTEAIAHTVLDRPLFRAGETVSMKHFIRLATGQGFALPHSLPAHAEIRHTGSDQTYEVPIQWNNNAGQSTWAIPKEAKLGLYTISLKTEDGLSTSGSFRVEQFRVPLMRAILQSPTKPVIQHDSVNIDAQLNYLSGGPASSAPVTFRSQLIPHEFSFPDYDEFTFGGKAPKEGIETVEPYSYDPENEDDTSENNASSNALGYPARTQNVTLDKNGSARVHFDHIPVSQDSRALDIEMEYSDPNGQRMTASTQALILPSALVLGLLSNNQVTQKHLRFKVLALDYSGKIQPHHKVAVEAYRQKTFSYRKRLLGGFYAYEQTQDVKRLGLVCKGETDEHGLLICDSEAPETGELVLVARSADAQGYIATASTTIYVSSEDNWYTASSSDRIDVLPNQRSYEPGETAHLEVRMPFREATALITVEREGILNAWVQPISAKSPFVNVPILKNYGPNAYVSVMVVRGRIDPTSSGHFSWLRRMFYRIGMFLGLVKHMPEEIDTHPTALVDLTKPAFKLGITQIRVGWKNYSLKVNVDPERAVYKIRDHAAINISVTDAYGKPAANAEIALAAVDEGLLSLAPAKSWDLLDAMMERRALEVDTSTAQSEVIGKRHFGKKAAAPGGGGGSATTRELFDTLLTWKPSIKLDAQGHARVDIPLNDSLTSFRIEAIAHQGIEKFGSGGASIHTTQDVMLLAGLPPFVREGDQFDAMVTARNGSQRSLTLDVSATPVSLKNATPQIQHVSIAAGQAITLHFPSHVPYNIQKLEWLIHAQETGATHAAQDTLKFTQTVGEAYPVHVYQQTLEQLEPEKPWRFPIQLPKGAITGRGGIDITLTRSLGGNINAIRDWMTHYPYTCLEQQVSQAIVLDNTKQWESIANSLNTYLDKDGLAKYFPIGWLEGSDTLTAYLLSITHDAHLKIPEGPQNLMIKGLQDFIAGRIYRYGHLQTADLVMRKLTAIDALARYNAADPKMLESLEIRPDLWPSSAVIDWISILTQMKTIPDRDTKLANARQILRSRLMFSGTTLSFSTEKADDLWWLMISPEVNAVRALDLLIQDPTFKNDIPRLARGTLSRQLHGHWNTTIANAWGVIALKHFQSVFEHETITGKSLITTQGQILPLDWTHAVSPASDDPTKGTPHGEELTHHLDWPSTSTLLSIEHQGHGNPWAFVTSRAALPLTQPVFAGYRLTRTLTPIEQHKKGSWSPGDIYRVTLNIDAQSDMTWVVINDPVPSGATILGSGLGGDSNQLTQDEKHSGWNYPAFEERAFDGFRAYYEFVPKGHFSFEYTVRLNNAGLFNMPASRIEAMYAPEVFGEIPVARMEVQAE